MKKETKNWCIFSIILILSVLVLSGMFLYLHESLKFLWTYRNGFKDFSDVKSPLFYFSFYCFGLILGTILPIKFLQKWLLKISYWVIGLSCLVLLVYIFFYNPAIGDAEPHFYLLGRYAVYADFCFWIIEILFLIGLGLCLSAFIKKIISKKNG